MRFLVANLAALFSLKLWRLLGYISASRQGVRMTDIAQISPKAQFGKGVRLGRVQIGSDVSIGEGTYLNGGIVASASIGRYCAVATNVLIGPSDHNYRLPAMSSRLVDQGPGKPRPVIGDDVWIGANVVILRGTRIGNGSVIGAGSIVTKDVPPYTVAAGVPCKVLRNRFGDETARATAEEFLRKHLAASES